jgi:hypothetical protein
MKETRTTCACIDGLMITNKDITIAQNLDLNICLNLQNLCLKVSDTIKNFEIKFLNSFFKTNNLNRKENGRRNNRLK